MNFLDLIKNNESISGIGLSLVERANRLGNAINSEASQSFDYFDKINGLISQWVSGDTFISEEDLQELYSFLIEQDDGSVTITTELFKPIVIRVTLPWGEYNYYTITVNGEEQCRFTVDEDDQIDEIISTNLHFPTVYPDGSPMDITPVDLVNGLAGGIQLPQIYGQLCKIISDNCDADPSSLVTAVSSIINDKLDYVGEIKTNLLSSATLGQEALFQNIINVFKGLQAKLQHAQQTGDVELNSTSFEVKAFSWGIVGGLLVNLAQVVAGVLVAVGGVISVISGIVASGIAIVKNIVGNVAAAITDTAFFCINPKGLPAFRLVLDEYQIDDNQQLNDALDALDCQTFTINGDTYPAIIIGYRLSPTSVKIQEVPSANFSLSNILYWNSGESVVTMANLGYIRTIRASHYDTSTAIGMVFSKTALSTNALKIISKSCYAPISPFTASYIDSLKDLTSATIISETACLYMERLLTSLILWCLMKSGKLWKTIADYKVWSGISFCPGENLVNANSLMGKQYQMILRFSEYYALSLDLSNESGTINFRQHQDDLVSTIGKFFNGLSWRVNESAVEYEELYFGYSDGSSHMSPTGVDSMNVTTLANLYYPELYIADLRNGPTFSWNDILGSNNSFIIDGLSSSCAINVPKALISGVFLGILADILIIAVLAVVASATVKLSLKIKNSLARKQANTAAAWYKYQDKVKEGASAEQQNAAWKEYKACRMKYNVAAMLTGSSKISLNYDDGNSSADVVNPIVSQLTGSSQTPTEAAPSLNDVLKLIAG